MTILERNYEIRGREDVQQFLEENIDIVSIIREAPKHIQKHFGQDKLILQVSSDPEEEMKRLMIYIQTSTSAVEAHQRLGALDDEWWLDASSESDPDSKVGINVEFK